MMPASVPGSISARLVRRRVLGIICLLAIACRSPHDRVPPEIEFIRLPPGGEGSPDIVYPIQGRVKGAERGQRIVLFARSGMWWVQPLAERPFTTILQNSTWKSTTHPGTAYAALLVDPDYNPPLTVNVLPQKGGHVQAVAIAEGSMLDQAPLKKVDFSGYEWLIRQIASNPAGTKNLYDAANAWVDARGWLHLRIAKKCNRVDERGGESSSKPWLRVIQFRGERHFTPGTVGRSDYLCMGRLRPKPGDGYRDQPLG